MSRVRISGTPASEEASVSNVGDTSRPRRGVTLSSAERRTLITLCLENRDGLSFQSMKKSFWTQMSAGLHGLTGRTYSWQSCRRCLLKWELAHPSPEGIPTLLSSNDDAPGASQRPRDTGRIVVNERNSGLVDTIGETAETEDDGRELSESPTRSSSEANDANDILPKTPIQPIRRDLSRPQCQMVEGETCERTCEQMETTMDNFRSQINSLSDILPMDPEERENIHRAFELLNDQVRTALKRYQGGID
ncbi:hypothetical protein N7468_004021 [Penicillium chermesinum]|uniref:Uncharacterized protein n=1 Tax=Penicillium chermesinum TaxID=63820 RepID=A0A9W9P7V3_9EURO|nr:uncharacterized protein N7468_004021 [Penicillium chermesinum]KAJ5239402.1 hypothetical protein N7468_004021 [Penicillium chermesinum]